MSNPLFDTLFRPTAPPRTLAPAPAPAAPGRAADTVASAAPVRVRGTRTRAGNAMSRTRAALMRGAALAVAENGTKITMAQVAVAAGVAKATLYNHLRTREAVLDALLLDQVSAIISAQRDKPLADALRDAALAISDHPVRLGLADIDPAALAALARIDAGVAGWRTARIAVHDALGADGSGGADTVLRWLASFLLTPADELTIAADVTVLLAGLPAVAPTA